jgi:hypothetical protein
MIDPKLIELLGLLAEDPMWADHAEISKRTLRRIIDALSLASKREEDLVRELERANLDRQASNVTLQYVSVTLGGPDEWTDQTNMVYSVRQTADETAAKLNALESALAEAREALSLQLERGEAADYLIHQLDSAFRGTRVRDLDEAWSCYTNTGGHTDRARRIIKGEKA